MKRRWIFALTLMSAAAGALQSKSLDQLQREELLDNAIVTLNEFDAKIDKVIKKRGVDCAKAVGIKPLCDCLMTDMPIAWSFNDYVAITTKAKEENGYSKMDKEYRAAYDMVAPIRDRCVRQINAKHK